jgi:penicillin-binding protein 1C
MTPEARVQSGVAAGDLPPREADSPANPATDPSSPTTTFCCICNKWLSTGSPAPKSRRPRRVLLVCAFGLVLAPLLGWLLLPLMPMPASLFAAPPAGAELLDRDGRPLRLARQGETPFQQRAAYAEFPPALIHATLAAEDARFWSHPGLDWRAIARAAWQLVRHQRVVSGGSTITQQLIKQAAPRARTFPAKAVEAARALRLEQLWDKQRILGEYLNRVDYGNFTLGAPAAANFYFGKRVSALSPAECALLAALPQAPSRLNPLRHVERARKRQRWILDQMLRRSWLSTEEHARAVDEPLRLVAVRHFAAPHFVEFLLSGAGVPADQSEESVETSPALPAGPIHTTLDLPLNQFAERTLRQQLAALQDRQAHNGAIVVLDNRTGGVLAMVGSEDFFAAGSGQVNGAWAPRSAGSTFKPFTYALALERGATAATVIADVPSSFATATGVFSPVNYDHRCRGPVSLREALGCSLNIPAVRTLDGIGGPAPLLERVRACGLTTLTENPEHYGLGLTIGNAEARLLELANAYACLARLGEYRPWEVLADPVAQTQHAPRNTPALFSPSAAWLIADILSDNAARAGAFGLESALRFDFPVACKTGTSTGFRDNWAFGYTPEFTVGVWVGNFDGSPMQDVSGVTGAAPILHALFEHLHARFGTSWYAAPPELAQMKVNRLTGKRFSENASQPRLATLARMEKFLPPMLPATGNSADYDDAGRVRLPGEYADWFGSAENTLRALAFVDSAPAAVRITFPLSGTTLFLDGDLPDQGRRITLSAQGSRELVWSSPTLAIQREGTRDIALLLPGRHELKVRDAASGAAASTWITVKEH